jgi:hypothetical protein
MFVDFIIVEFFNEAQCFGIWLFFHFQGTISPIVLDPLDRAILSHKFTGA